jgi:ABC-2 type transport system permease protein
MHAVAQVSQVAQRPIFARLHRRLFRNSLGVVLQRSRLRLALILVLSLTIWGGLYVLFREGFVFLRNLETTVPISYYIIELLFGTFFLVLTGLLIFSVGVFLHESLFRGAETRFLLSTPAATDQIYGYKFQEAVFFSGWAFLLLGAPLLVAYGIEMGAEWPYYLLFLPFLIGFLILPASIGALGCFLIVDLFPRYRRLVLLLLVLVVIVLVVIWAIYLFHDARSEALSEAWLRKLLNQLRPSQWWGLPSRWMTAGLMAAAHNRFPEATFNLALVWSNGLLFYLISAWTARRVYRRAYNGVQSSGGGTTSAGFFDALFRASARAFDWFVARSLAWTDHRTRLFILKDLRTFRRDPAQLAQVLILGGILFLYFINIRWLPHGHYAVHERTLIGLLNVGVIGMMLATYTSRFVFPLMSLEGRNFWVLGLMPISRERLLLSKFAYAATVTVSTSLALALLSEVMLRLPWPVILIHLLAMLVLSLGLSAISVGLGTYLVNLKETNPSKIATGFGGTINLLVSLIFAILAILLAGLPTLIYFADRELRQQEMPLSGRLQHWLVASLAALVVLGVAAVVLPLRLGMRAFRRMEF